MIADDGDPLTVSRVWPVIPNRMVLRTAVIPESEGVGFPIDAAIKSRGRVDQTVKHLKYGL